MELDRTCIHGNNEHRNGVLRNLDAHLVRTGHMWTVIIILILAVILWWPRKGDE